jgi:type II secretory pathway component GspD/PulD (secretin)
VGLILGVTPRVSPDGPVVMEVDVEKSHVGPEPGGTPTAAAGDQAAMLGIETTQVQTTVRVPNGQTIVLGSITERGKPGKEVFIVLTPHVLDGEKAKKPR